MTIPSNLLSNGRPESPLLSPDDRQRTDPRRDWERGGVALNDPSLGHDVRDWTAWTDGLTVWVAPDPELTPAVAVQSGTDITEVSLSFDQNMQPTLAYVDAGVTKLWWYDTTVSGMVTTSYIGYRTPMLTLDDKRALTTATGLNDIVFAYVRDGLVCWRQQRERFTVERVLGPAPSANSRIIGMGMSEGLRLQIKLSIPPSALYADRLSDTLFVLTAEDIVPLLGGPVASARWRSKTFQADEVPIQSWARVEGAYPCTFRLFGDGALVQTTTVADDEPFRLRAGRFREWAVELEGSTRVVGLRMAQSMDDLWG